jgi:hypothetical protein
MQLECSNARHVYSFDWHVGYVITKIIIESRHNLRRNKCNNICFFLRTNENATEIQMSLFIVNLLYVSCLSSLVETDKK